MRHAPIELWCDAVAQLGTPTAHGTLLTHLAFNGLQNDAMHICDHTSTTAIE
jgi:hypothetical protein